MVTKTLPKNLKSPSKIRKATKEVEIIEMTEEIPSKSQETNRNGLEEVMSQADKAYSAYIIAQQEVARSYHENEIHVVGAYQRAQNKAYRSFDTAVAKAAKERDETLIWATEAREKAIQQVEVTFKETKDKAESTYDAAVSRALQERDSDLEQASKLRDETIEQAWLIYSKVTR